MIGGDLHDVCGILFPELVGLIGYPLLALAAPCIITGLVTGSSNALEAVGGDAVVGGGGLGRGAAVSKIGHRPQI
jgi:hypothetical protein